MLQQNVDSNNEIYKRGNVSSVKIRHPDPAESFQGKKYLVTP